MQQIFSIFIGVNFHKDTNNLCKFQRNRIKLWT